MFKAFVNIIILHNIMSFTSLNSINSNLWKGGKVKPILYGLSVRTADLSVNSISVTYRYSGVSYVTMDTIGSSGYISSQPRFNVVSSPVTNIITGLVPNTYYNFVLVPYDKNDISGSSYYFNGFTSGSSTFTSINGPITSISSPINYSNLGTPFCTLSAIYSLVVSAYDFSSVDLSFNYTDLSYISIVQTGGSNNNYNKNFNELSGTYNSSIQIYSLKSKIQNIGLTMLRSYSYNVTPYNNLNFPGTSLTVSGVSWPSFLININGNTISSYSNVTQLSTINNYILITFNTNGSIQFNKNITGNTLLVGCGGGGGIDYTNNSSDAGGGGGGGGGEFYNVNYNYNNLLPYIINVGIINTTNRIGGNTFISNNSNIILNSLGGGAGGYVPADLTLAPRNAGNGASGGGGAGGDNGTVTPGNPGNGIVGKGNVGGRGGLGKLYGNGGGGAGGGGAGGGGSNGYIGDGSNYRSVGGSGGSGKLWPINNNTYSRGGYGGYGSSYDSRYTFSMGQSVPNYPKTGADGSPGICIIAVPFY